VLVRSRYETDWNECSQNGTHIPQARDKYNTYFFIFLQQLLGGGEIEEMHEVFNNLQAAERSLATVPIFENLLYFLIATRNIPSIKNTIGFRGIIFELVVRLNNAPIRCNYFLL
jgi:hypothetical protein